MIINMHKNPLPTIFTMHIRMHMRSNHHLFLSRAPLLQPRVAPNITLQLIIRLIVPRVHLILQTIFEAELAALDFLARGCEFGFREAHGFEECYGCFMC